eukprot:6186376-Pleurochrysis_carterae.AAC.5
MKLGEDSRCATGMNELCSSHEGNLSSDVRTLRQETLRVRALARVTTVHRVGTEARGRSQWGPRKADWLHAKRDHGENRQGPSDSQRSVEVPVIARNACQANLKCPEPGPAQAATSQPRLLLRPPSSCLSRP